MKKYYKYIAIAFIAFIGWYLYPSDYDRQMSKALKEQRAHPETKVFDGEIEPPMPNREENDKTILGIDSNKNGIRDDVDIWINRSGIDYNERMAMRQYAKVEQERLKICSEEQKESANEVITKWLLSKDCLNVFSYPRSHKDIGNIINKLVISNEKRKKCLMFFEENVTSYGDDGKNLEWHERCDFEIQNKAQVIEKYHKVWGYTK